jgi:hypothetical protein
MTTNLNDVPEACTLPTEQRPLRRAEFDDLFATVVGRDRVAAGHLRLVLTAAEAEVRDLTARETECCSFFRFTIAARPGAVVLDIEVPPVQVAVLDAIESRLPASARELAERRSALGGTSS